MLVPILLFALGLVLLFMAFAINVLMTFIKHRGRI